MKEIDWYKCYQDMSDHEPKGYLGPYIRQRIEEYVKAYHRQREEQLQPLFMHYHRVEGATQSKTGSPEYEEPPPPETCRCEGRTRLVDLGSMYYKKEHNCWYLCAKFEDSGQYDGLHQDSCPLCYKPLPLPGGS